MAAEFPERRSRRLHVAYVNKTAFDSTLPSVNFSLHYACGLAMAGAHCTLFGQKKSAVWSSGQLLERFGLEPQPDLTIRLSVGRRILGIRSNQWFYRDTFRALRKNAAGGKADVVISRDPGALPYLAGLRRHGVPVFYQPHNFYADLSVRPDVNPKNVRKYHWLETRYVPKMSGLLCLQSAQAVWYRNAFPDVPVHVAPPGLIACEKPAKPRSMLIGYVGSLQSQKGIDGLLRAFGRVRQAFPASRLLLLGGRNPDEIASAEKAVRALHLGASVEMTGWMPYQAVCRRLRDVAVGVIPLKDNFYNRYLTAPNKLFDYMAAAVPVITSDLPSVRALMTEREAVFIRPDDTGQLAEALLRLAGDSEALSAMREAVHRRALSFLWPDHGTPLLKQLEHAVADSAH